MCNWPDIVRRLLALALITPPLAAGAQARYDGIGRAALPAELAAWDIDVRPDFKGLPAGRGSVAQGMEVWEAKCASCHGVFGESNETFTPLIGGTTAADVKSGHVARLRDEAYPQRTTMMKLSSLSTLWDYIRRAMPWNAPKSLSVDEVYAVTAYMLNLAGVLPDTFILSDANIRDAQRLVPNRDGMTTAHGLWPARRSSSKPDAQGSTCMRDCSAAIRISSSLPDHARNSHGNLAEQNRLVGAQFGANTLVPAAAQAARPGYMVAAPASAGAAMTALLTQHNCLACHGVDRKVLGPALQEVAARHGNRPDAAAYLERVITAGGQGVWGTVPMPPQVLPPEDLRRIAAWIAAGAR